MSPTPSPEPGKTDILLLERASDVGQVTTSQGAGLCGQVRDSAERIKLAMHSVATFRELQRDPDVKPDWHEVGSLRIALTERRAEEFRRLKAGRGSRPASKPSLIDQAGSETPLAADGFRQGQRGSLVPVGRLHDTRTAWSKRTSTNAESWASASPLPPSSKPSSARTAASPV